MCDGNHDCPQTNKSSGGEDEDNCEVSADGKNTIKAGGSTTISKMWT